MALSTVIKHAFQTLSQTLGAISSGQQAAEHALNIALDVAWADENGYSKRVGELAAENPPFASLVTTRKFAVDAGLVEGTDVAETELQDAIVALAMLGNFLGTQRVREDGPTIETALRRLASARFQ